MNLASTALLALAMSTDAFAAAVGFSSVLVRRSCTNTSVQLERELSVTLLGSSATRHPVAQETAIVVAVGRLAHTQLPA